MSKAKLVVCVEQGRQVMRILGPGSRLRMPQPQGIEAQEVLDFLVQHLPPLTDEDMKTLREYGVDPVIPEK